jgi:hypothetical protein
MVPVSSPLNGELFDCFTFALRDSFCPLSPWFTLSLNHALKIYENIFLVNARFNELLMPRKKIGGRESACRDGVYNPACLHKRLCS